MDINSVINYVRMFDELDTKEKAIVIDFIENNKDSIIVDPEIVEEGPYNDDYYNVTVEGPNNFYLVFEKGCDTDHLSMLELDCEGILN